MGSAIAFRLFLFFVPLLLLVVGIAGFASDLVTAGTVSRNAGIYGSLGAEISEAFHQPGFTRWFAVLFGLFGVVTAGRSLSRVLRAASAAAWRLPLSGSRASLRAAGLVAGLICGMALIAILVNRVREDVGLGVAGLTFVPALVIYGLAWLGVSLMLPRATQDPGALLPGSLLVALIITVMHAVSEFYLPGPAQPRKPALRSDWRDRRDAGVVLHSRERNRPRHGTERRDLRAIRKHF